MFLIQGFRLWLTWFLTCVFWTPVLLIYLGTFRILPEIWFIRLINFWGYFSLWLMGVKLVLVNESPFKGKAPRVAVVNHHGTLDILWSAAITPPGAMGLGKKEVLYLPVINLAWIAMRFVTVDRSNHKKALESMAKIPELIQTEKRTLFIAPEGTRSREGKMLPFKKGAFVMAQQSKAPIYPIVISGSFDLMPRHAWTPKPGEMWLKFLPPIETKDWKTEDLDRHIEAIRSNMIAELEKMDQERRRSNKINQHTS